MIYWEATDDYTCNTCDEDVLTTMRGTIEEGIVTASGTCPICKDTLTVEFEASEHDYPYDPDTAFEMQRDEEAW